MTSDINKHVVVISNLKEQNEYGLWYIKHIYRKLKELEQKITQIKYIDTTLADKLKKDYESLKKVIIDENIQVELTNDINDIKSRLENLEKLS